jgi:hypothetical protein
MPYLRHPNTFCTVCNESIYKRPSQIKKNNGHVFCGIECYRRSIRKERPCLVCGVPILARFNKKTCSRACANKHRAGIRYKLHLPRKDKVVSERMLKLRLFRLRGTTCEVCSYNKVQILHVHHKDRNHQNNVFSNLQILCPNCHYEEHYLEKSWLSKYNLHH